MYLISICILCIFNRLVSSGRNSNRTLRLSNHFERPENLNLLWDGDNFDSLIRGLTTQLQKRPDSNIDKEACSLNTHLYVCMYVRTLHKIRLLTFELSTSI